MFHGRPPVYRESHKHLSSTVEAQIPEGYWLVTGHDGQGRHEALIKGLLRNGLSPGRGDLFHRDNTGGEVSASGSQPGFCFNIANQLDQSSLPSSSSSPTSSFRYDKETFN